MRLRVAATVMTVGILIGAPVAASWQKDGVLPMGGEYTTTTHPATSTTHPPYTTTTQPAPTTTATTTPREVTTTTAAPTSTSSTPTSTSTSTTDPSTSTTAATTSTTIAGKKVFVCKYEGTPGVDERLQTGQNPISIDYKVGREPGQYFNDAQGRSYVLAYDIGQDEPDVSECPPPNTGTTTTSSSTTTTGPTTSTSTTSPTTSTTVAGSTTTSSTTGPTTTTSTTSPTSTSTTTSTTVAPTTSTSTSTTLPRPSLLGIDDFAFCGSDNLPEISITFGNRPDLNGVPGLLTFSDGTDYSGNPLVFQSGQTITFPYPASLTTPLTLTYANSGETATAVVTLPENCPPEETTTSTSSTSTTTPTTTSSTTTTTTSSTTSSSTSTTSPPTTSSTTTTTQPGTTTTSSTSPSTTTTLPDTFTFGAAGTVCVSEVPTIRIVFQNQFPSLAGQTGTLTMRDVNGIVVGTESVVYQPGATVDILYPGTSVNADGSVADVPGWILNSDGFWILDPSDAVLRDGIFLTYTVNPTAGPVLVTYPPESSACANPDGPFPPGTPVVPPGGGELPPTR